MLLPEGQADCPGVAPTKLPTFTPSFCRILCRAAQSGEKWSTLMKSWGRATERFQSQPRWCSDKTVHVGLLLAAQFYTFNWTSGSLVHVVVLQKYLNIIIFFFPTVFSWSIICKFCFKNSSHSSTWCTHLQQVLLFVDSSSQTLAGVANISKKYFYIIYIFFI